MIYLKKVCDLFITIFHNQLTNLIGSSAANVSHLKKLVVITICIKR